MAEPFKEIFNEAAVRRIAQDLAPVPGFDPQAFLARVLPALPGLELKDRVHHIADAFAACLPGPYPVALEALLGLMGPVADLDRKNQFDFRLWPVTSFVERHGLDHPEPSYLALHALTQRWSGEFAIRPFLVRYPQQTLARLAQWAEDPSPHVRRLVSEGSRPRLPWGLRLQAFVADPEPGLALLQRLFRDPHPYVRRSVANHLGDIAKDHPARAVQVAAGWLAASKDPRTVELVRHGLRHPIKQGDPAALALLGVDPGARLELSALEVTPRLRLGESLQVRAVLHNRGEGPVQVEVDLVLQLRKADGRLRPKVFKGARKVLGPGEAWELQRKLPLREVSTRRHHPGLQRLDLQVNGQILGGQDFELS